MSNTSPKRERGTAPFDHDLVVSLALVGAGSGGKNPDEVLELMLDEVYKSNYAGEARIVRYVPTLSGTKPQ